MPTITEFDAPQGIGLRPPETGITATAQAARRVQGEFNEMAAAKEATGRRIGSTIEIAGKAATLWLDHEQISRGAPALAGLMAAKNKRWDEIAKDPASLNDPTVAQRFLEQE